MHRRALCTEPPNARKLCSADLVRVCPNHSCAQQLGRVEFAAPVWVYGRLLVASADPEMLTPPVAPGAILTTEACLPLNLEPTPNAPKADAAACPNRTVYNSMDWGYVV